ncbi:MAG: Na/Pi symporter [candidate division KSB1 bacterium]|nr:Na/Pi symporter [candidate division KSB1 bacterium]
MIPNLLGGIGLFLLGMILLTDGLKAVAGEALRRVLSRFVRGPFSALLSGATVTMLVQSSSATTLTTIGFVSAGLLTFPQAVGVMFGANLGTTSTGWIVAVLGLKISVGKLALPLIGVGALLRLLTRDRLAAGGLALAGFGLIFVGIDTLQAGMAHLAELFDPSQLPGETFSGRLLLVAMGIAMTVVMQSSSAAVATTLTALHSGAIDLTQAAALVVGQNVGTTVTAGLACIGAATAAKRTAIAHILFNLITGIVALAILPYFVRLADALAHGLEDQPGALSLATFHTVFNVLGVLLLLPWTRGYARLIERFVPERGPALTRRLDATVATVAPVAIEATRLTLREIALVLSEYLQNMLRNKQGRPNTEALQAVSRALDETRKFIGRVRSDPETKAEHQRHIGTLHAMDHLERLLESCREAKPAPWLERDAALAAAAGRLSEGLAAIAPWLSGSETVAPVDHLATLSVSLAETRRTHRLAILEETAAGRADAGDTLARLEALRWLDRLGYHIWRAVHHLADGNEDEPGVPKGMPVAEPPV